MAKHIGLILIFIVIVSVFFSGAILKAEVKNEDNPLKGNWDFKLRKLWEVDRAGDYALTQIADLQIGDDGRIYILESKQDKFFVFDQNGKFVFSFGNKGEGPGEFKMVDSFFLKGQYIILPDQERAHYFNKNGKYVKSYNYGSMIFPRTFLDEFRFLFVRDSEDGKEKFEKLETLDLNNMKHTTIVEISSEKKLTASAGRFTIHFKDRTTTPMVIVAEHNNEIYFGKNDRYFIKKVDINGKELLSFSISGREQKKISVNAKRERFENVRLNSEKIPKEMVDQLVKKMPDYCTYYGHIAIGKNGLIYIHLNDASNKTAQEMDIFSPEGKYLFHANIQLPQGLKKHTPLLIKENNLIVFVEDEEGEQKLVKFQIDPPTNY